MANEIEGKWELNETKTAVQICKKGVSFIGILCEVPIYPHGGKERPRQLGERLLNIVNTHTDLLEALEDLVYQCEFSGRGSIDINGPLIAKPDLTKAKSALETLRQ